MRSELGIERFALQACQLLAVVDAPALHAHAARDDGCSSHHRACQSAAAGFVHACMGIGSLSIGCDAFMASKASSSVNSIGTTQPLRLHEKSAVSWTMHSAVSQAKHSCALRLHEVTKGPLLEEGCSPTTLSKPRSHSSSSMPRSVSPRFGCRLAFFTVLASSSTSAATAGNAKAGVLALLRVGFCGAGLSTADVTAVARLRAGLLLGCAGAANAMLLSSAADRGRAVCRGCLLLLRGGVD